MGLCDGAETMYSLLPCHTKNLGLLEDGSWRSLAAREIGNLAGKRVSRSSLVWSGEHRSVVLSYHVLHFVNHKCTWLRDPHWVVSNEKRSLSRAAEYLVWTYYGISTTYPWRI